MIYLDHAATSFPKPDEVVDAVASYLREASANPGRSAHRISAQAARVVYESREALARLLGVRDSRRLVFMPNATTAINAVLRGFLRAGDHVIATSMDHNAVARPLRRMRESLPISVTPVTADREGRFDPEDFAAAARPSTRLAVIIHGSNVTGTVAPLAEIRAALGTIPLLIDAAQTAGAWPIDFDALGAEFLAFSGHKSLLGPQGIGGLCLREGVELEPLVQGGTGSLSESDSQPDFLPDRFESGTLNGPGIAGLGAAARWLEARGLASIRRHERELLEAMLSGLGAIDGVILHGGGQSEERLPIVSFTVEGISPKDVAFRLDREYEIMTRAGLHCAPLAHRTLGTAPHGTVRFAAGPLNSRAEIGAAIAAVASIARGVRP